MTELFVIVRRVHPASEFKDVRSDLLTAYPGEAGWKVLNTEAKFARRGL
jgi:hypothetical protein